ncbi:MAG: DUF1800 family protein [Bacteroidota bacterium]
MASLQSRTGLLGKRHAAHLLRRATFGPTKAEILQFSQLTASQAVSQLLTLPAKPALPIDPQTNKTWVTKGRKKGQNSSKLRLRKYLSGWWMEQILQSAQPSILHKMQFFFHTRFTTNMGQLLSEDNYYTLELFRQYALGSYRDLAEKMCRDNAMIIYLDTALNKKKLPNENFAREFLELFTIGKGPQIGPENYTTYTEDDVRAAARLFTGWRTEHRWWDSKFHDPETGIPRGKAKTNAHDSKDKYFSDAFVSPSFASPVRIKGKKNVKGMEQELRLFVDMIFAQEATAQNIVRKLYQYFVHYQITSEVEQDIILPLAAELKSSNYVLKPVLQKLLESEHFYDIGNQQTAESCVGGMIKNPLELLLGSMRFFKVSYPDPKAEPEKSMLDFYKKVVQDFLLPAYGMPLFSPKIVAGYDPFHQEPAYNRLWASTTTLPFRFTLGQQLVSGKKVSVPGKLLMEVDMVTLANDPGIVPDLTAPEPYTQIPGTYRGGRFADHLVRSILEYVLPFELSQDRFDYFLHDLLLDNLSEINWRFEWLKFEQTGDDSSIRPQLNQLFEGILQSPEYQLT